MADNKQRVRVLGEDFTPEQKAKIKQTKERVAELKANGQYEAARSYARFNDAVGTFNKKLTTVTNYRISEFYKASKVRQALTSVTLNNATDSEAIKAKLLKDLPAVKRHLESLASDYLTITEWHALPADNKAAEPYKAYFEALPNGGFKLKSGKEQALLTELAKLPKRTIISLTLAEPLGVELMLPNGLVAARKLASDAGITQTGRLIAGVNYNDDGSVKNAVIGGTGVGYKEAITASDNTVLDYLVATLARIKEQGDKTAKSRARSNIKDGHDALPRPATTTLGELFESSVFDGDRVKKIYDDIRTPEALHEAGGYKIEATQQLLPLFKASNDYKTLQDLLKANIPQLEKVLITVLREADATGGYTAESRHSKITALAKPIYREQMAKRGKLDGVYRDAYTNNLLMLDALKFFKYDKPSKYGGGTYTKFKFIEIAELHTNKKGNVVAVTWRLTDEFIKVAPTLIYVNVDGFLDIKTPAAQMLGSYINDSFVMSDSRANRTILGEPMERQAKLLADKAGLSKSNVTERYRYLTDSLNELERLGIIKWQAGDGTQVVKASIKASHKVTIWPSKNTSDSHITKKLHASTKQAEADEQKARQQELKALMQQYRKELGSEYKDYLADDLGVSTQELDMMLFKGSGTQTGQIITDGVLKKIKEYATD